MKPRPLEATPLETEIVSALRRIIRAVDLHSRHLTEVAGLTGPQLLTLREAERLGAVPIGVLSRAIHLSQPTVTGIVARLEQRDFVRRERAAGDRRRSLVTVTTAGRRVLRKAPSLLHDKFREELSRLETWEQTMTLAALQRIASMMHAEDLDAAPLLATGSLAPPEEDGPAGADPVAAAVLQQMGHGERESVSPPLQGQAPAPRTGAEQRGRVAKLPWAPVLRLPRVEDARTLWQLVCDLGALDRNSAYAYLLVCTHFRDTSVVADWEGRHVGFVAGYRPPDHEDTLFVWQIGVVPAARRRGLGVRMIREILRRPASAGIRFVEATVTNSNTASEAMFRAVASAAHAPCTSIPRFAAEHFPGGAHEPERVFRIGPIDASFRRP